MRQQDEWLRYVAASCRRYPRSIDCAIESAVVVAVAVGEIVVRVVCRKANHEARKMGSRARQGKFGRIRVACSMGV